MSPLRDPTPASRAGTEPPPSRNGIGATILLVDDDGAVRRVLARYLVQLGYWVIEAGDAVDALLHATPESRVDLVLSDITLPGIHGPELLRKLRVRWPSVKTLLMTGYSEEALHREDWPPGTGLLVKPFVLEELRLLLASQIGPGTNLSPSDAPDSEGPTQKRYGCEPATERKAS